MAKYKVIVVPPAKGDVYFYGAEIGDVIEEIQLYDDGAVWTPKSVIFREEGWDLATDFCLANSLEAFLKYAEEIV